MRPQIGDGPRLYDCFLFFRELDVLELRLRELWPAVHRFVLIESRTDFAGNPKPLIFAENRARFALFDEKIVHLVVEDEPVDPNLRFAFQHHQRDRALAGLADAAPDDLAMIADLDEIPRRESLARAAEILARRRAYVVLRMPHHSMRLNLVHPGKIITGPRVVRVRDFRRPYLVRRLKSAYWRGWPDWLDQIPARFNAAKACGRPLPRVTIRDAGWHFSSVGGADLMDAKFRSFLKDERGLAANRTHEAAAAAMVAGERLADRFGLVRVGVDTLPETVQRDPERYSHLMA